MHYFTLIMNFKYYVSVLFVCYVALLSPEYFAIKSFINCYYCD